MSNFLLWWEQLKADFITCFITKDRWRYITRGLGNTLKIALVAVLLGIAIGSVVAIVRSAHDTNIHAMRPGPGRTLLKIANAINETMAEPHQYVYDRHSRRCKRDKNEIGIHAIRGGTIVGEHEVLFAGHDETITISHSAASKGVFAVGSINAAVFLQGKKAGLYDMNVLINERG